MCMKKKYRAALVVAAVAALLAGCATSSPVRVLPLVGATAYPPTDPESVAVLQAEPQIPYEALGQIVFEPQSAASMGDMEQKLRQAGASLGANAVIIKADLSMQAGAGSSQSSGSQVVSGIAIRYK
jgi:hypothetical protein